MNDEERFERVLGELRELMKSLAHLEAHIVMIGGQVLALEAMSRGLSPVIQVDLDTGVPLSRGFSFEPDLLIDVDAAPSTVESVVDVLKARSYRRTRDFRWSKQLDDEWTFDLDLFRPEDADAANIPTGMTPVDATLALARPHQLRVALAGGYLEIKVPDPAGFLATKLAAKQVHRPDETKDCFDIAVYVQLIGVDPVAQSLRRAGAAGEAILVAFQDLFGNADAAGVRDVLKESANLDRTGAELVAEGVVDLFTSLAASSLRAAPSEDDVESPAAPEPRG
ncbi:MAG: hypothetical protein IPG45_30460 [Deltaproteobacteria bacterium]|nr:hypothetical protein [Deltaproteobacteria bacterium]